MKNVLPLLLLCCLGFSTLHTIAQPICGFDAALAKRIKDDPKYGTNLKAGEASLRTYIQQHPELMLRRNSRKTITGLQPHTLSSSYQIPIVVHVIHTGGDIGTIYNPTDAQILGAIDYLNQVYNGTWPGTVGTGYGAGDLGIQFVLAQRDPNCNPTNGINRIDGSAVANYVAGGINSPGGGQTGGTDEINIKNLSRWDYTQYYNVWIVNKIDGNDGTSGQFIAGYAYLPGPGMSSSLDGIVMLATQMVAGQKTLPHEIGHAFWLYHPFAGSTDVTQCPPSTNCSVTGDQVCDTDPISENINSGTGVINFTPRTGANTCAPPDNYTPATEYNYMNYTSTYTLFTPGQAARMQATAAGIYRTSLTTSLGGTPPDASCGSPKIDFQLQGDRNTETSAATSGCRNYKDYTYNMLIGGGSTATTTATLTLNSGSTAVQGVDFDMTTNSSFTSPSSVLTFPAGSSTSLPFTIRVYDDASVNGTRTAILGFTVNNGGGNAIAGDSRPTFTLTIRDNDYAPTTGVTPYGTATIGTFSYLASGTPFDATQLSQRAQFLYTAAELSAAGIPAGPISSIGFYVWTKQSTRAYTNLNIKMGLLSVTHLYDGSTLVEAGSTLQVAKSLSSYSTTSGINTFKLDAPFQWDGTSSIVVEICYDNGTASASDATDQLVFYRDGSASNQANALFQDGIDCEQPFSSPYLDGAYGLKPLAYFTSGIPATVIQTALNSSQSQYLGPNADVYFYDQTNGQLMARIQNLSSFDYGCTQVVIDRAGTSATQFWNTTAANYLMDKTFHVIPTTNNSSGSYNISLYYTQAEVQGWQTATGQTLGAIQLVKTPGQIYTVTPANPTAAGTPTIVTPTIGALGTNTSLTYNFTNGFSGFGAGIPNMVNLPLTLLRFTGRLDNDNAILSWSTAIEENMAGFEIERSNDGQHFSSIGYVHAAGNSNTEQDYTFTDPSLTTDSNYYQLKELSFDGQATYSNIVLIRDPHASPRFTVLPNPFSTSLDLLFGHVPAQLVQIRLLDITGRELWRRAGTESEGSRLHLDFSGTRLATGVYLLEVSSANDVQTKIITHE